VNPQKKEGFKVKQRLVVLEYVKTHSLLAASRRFGMKRKTIREWRDRYEAKGIPGLIPTYPDRRKSRLPAEALMLIEDARREFGYGAARTRVWPRLTSRKRRVVKLRQLRLFEMPHAGDSVQVDVKVVKLKGQKAYQYTALDDAPAIVSCGSIGARTSESASTSSRSCVPCSRSRFAASSVTTARSSRWPSRSRSKRPALSTGTSSRGAPSRTARSNAVTESTTRSSGIAMSLANSTPPSENSVPGNGSTILALREVVWVNSGTLGDDGTVRSRAACR